MEVEDRLAIPPCKPEHRKLETPYPMKTTALRFGQIAATIALLLAGATQKVIAQTSSTDPVGFIKINIAGGGSLNSPRLTLLSPTLTQPVFWQGTITAVSTNTTGPTAITVSGSPWTAGQFEGANGSFFAEVVTVSPNTHTTGAISVITSTTTGTITLTDNLISPNLLAAAGDTVRIRKDVTIGSLFGTTNSAGLLASDDPITADEVLVYDGANQTPYFYYTGDGQNPAGWYDSAFTGPAANVVIGPHQGVVVKRKAAGALSLTSTGGVKTGNTVFPVVSGLNVLGTVSAQGFTLGTSGLYTGNAATGVKASDDPITADEVIIYTATSQTPYFYYTGDAQSPAGWYDSAFTGSAANVVIAPGSAFVVKRKFGGAFNWSLPSPSNF